MPYKISRGRRPGTDTIEFMARDPFTLMKIFAPLSVDLDREDSFPKKRPLLAHYTTVGVLEAILRNKEVWFSNPLFMNDVEEVLWGIDLGAKLLKSSSEVQASCETPRRFEMLLAAFNDFYSGFTNEHVLDLYVLCLSEHAKDDTDGLLSMWRGYGGNGNGAAIVLDTAQIDMHEDSPLIISKVDYGTAEKRTEWLQQRIVQFADILKKSNIADDELLFAAFCFFKRLTMFAIFSKHHGFREENEWRIVYWRRPEENQTGAVSRFEGRHASRRREKESAGFNKLVRFAL